MKCFGKWLVCAIAALLVVGLAACSRPSAQTTPPTATDSIQTLDWNAREAAMRQRMADLDLKQRYWLEERIPAELGQARLQELAADSTAFAQYRELDDRLATIVNSQRQVYFEFASLRPRLDSLPANNPERQRIAQRLAELAHQDQQLYDSYIVWESAMITYLQRWKTPRPLVKLPRS